MVSIILDMVEIGENPNLRPDGKRRTDRKRKGLRKPRERLEELWEKDQESANEVLESPPKAERSTPPSQRDLPMDYADRSDEKLKEEKPSD